MEAVIEDVRQQIVLQVQTAFLNWQASLQRIQLAQQALSSSQVDLTRGEALRSGLSDIVELEDAQRHYTADDAAHANAVYGFSVAKAAVDQAAPRSLAAPNGCA